MKISWKRIGLWCSLCLEIMFLFLYLSLLLEKIGSPFGDVIWLASGVSGIVFGRLNLTNQKHKFLPSVVLVMGVLFIMLWILAVMVASM